MSNGGVLWGGGAGTTNSALPSDGATSAIRLGGAGRPLPSGPIRLRETSRRYSIAGSFRPGQAP